MSLNWTQFHSLVVVPTLKSLQPRLLYSVATDVLVSETLWHESGRLQALGQYPRDGVTERMPVGPGLGIGSIEEATWDWMRKTKLGKHLLVMDYCQDGPIYPFYEELAWNLRLNVIACRLRYALDPAPLPSGEKNYTALVERATYWGRVYQGRSDLIKIQRYMSDAEAIPWEVWPG